MKNPATAHTNSTTRAVDLLVRMRCQMPAAHVIVHPHQKALRLSGVRNGVDQSSARTATSALNGGARYEKKREAKLVNSFGPKTAPAMGAIANAEA